jgi:predicted anti-sigma-YlaC factor YlaD
MLAHFTTAELPGTLGLILAAFALGVLSMHRELRPRIVTVPLMVVLTLAVAVAVLDSYSVIAFAVWMTKLADVALLVAAAILCAIALRNTRGLVVARFGSR